MKFHVRVLSGLEEVAMIHGQVEVDVDSISAMDSIEVIRCEQTLERLTGLRFHINAEEV